MNVLIVGNMGYVGPVLVRHLRQRMPGARITGFDSGYFAHCLTTPTGLPEVMVDTQHFGDLRAFPEEIFSAIDSVILLAGLSNDPIGNRFEGLTHDINSLGSEKLARAARAAGVRNFVFASSCSVYGLAEDGARTERSEVNPLTPYAKSKVYMEDVLGGLAGDDFVVTCLRFATACGMSERLRLDLVLNDFVASAITCRKITVLSDGTPWRPLIHVKDMARAIEWAIIRDGGDGFMALNTGGDGWNCQVRDLAFAVSEMVPGTEVSINNNAQPDSRSYRVDFSAFRGAAPDHQPLVGLEDAILDLKEGLESIGFADKDFRNASLIRLNVLTALTEAGTLTDRLTWAKRN